MNSRFGSVIAGALLVSTALTTATAQTLPSSGAIPANQAPVAPQGQSPAQKPVEEVVVTARRRSERLESVPIAVTALGKSLLTQKSVQTTSDLQSAVPGLTIRQTGNSNSLNYAIRGQSVDAFTNSPPGVLPYIDEVQIVSKSADVFYDLGTIQVLKGPQGTLFGRNTTGGAVLYDTAKPTSLYGGYIDARYESYDGRHVEGAVNLPFSDKISLRVAGSYSGGGAYVHDLLAHSWYGDLIQDSGRATLVVRPFEGLTNTTVVQYTKDSGTDAPSVLYSAYPCGSSNGASPLITTATCLYNPGFPAFDAFIAAHPNLYPGGVLAYLGVQRALGPWQSEANYVPTHQAESKFVINTTSYEINEDLTIKNIAGFNSSKARDGFDDDGTPYPIAQQIGTPNSNGVGVTGAHGTLFGATQASEELQLQGKAFGERLTYSVGAYYSYEHDLYVGPNEFFSFAPIAPATFVPYNFDSIDRSYAAYGQATYKLTSALSVTGGIRYSWESIFGEQGVASLYGPGQLEKVSFSKPSWTVSLDDKVLPGWLLYVATRGSWRAGGFNGTASPVAETAAEGGNLFLPETTEDVEIGSKFSSHVGGVPVVLNIAAFNQWVHNVQRVAYVVLNGAPAALTANVPEAEVTGFEADGLVQPTPWLSFGGSVSYDDARYTSRNVLLFGSKQAFGPYADTPRWNGSLFTEITHELGSDLGTVVLHVDGYAQSSDFFSNQNNTISPGTQLPGYALFNTRLSWQNIAGSRVTAALFVKNIANKKYYAGGFPTGADLGINGADPGLPRFIGGELRCDF
jgi:iron complex outermembrane receptor protein